MDVVHAIRERRRPARGPSRAWAKPSRRPHNPSGTTPSGPIVRRTTMYATHPPNAFQYRGQMTNAPRTDRVLCPCARQPPHLPKCGGWCPCHPWAGRSAGCLRGLGPCRSPRPRHGWGLRRIPHRYHDLKCLVNFYDTHNRPGCPMSASRGRRRRNAGMPRPAPSVRPSRPEARVRGGVSRFPTRACGLGPILEAPSRGLGLVARLIGPPHGINFDLFRPSHAPSARRGRCFWFWRLGRCGRCFRRPRRQRLGSLRAADRRLLWMMRMMERGERWMGASGGN